MRSLLQILYNYHTVTPDVARSAQPYLGFASGFFTQAGIKSIINLRGENPDWSWWRREKALAASLGLAHADIRMSSRLIPARATLVLLFDVFDAVPKPILLKCSGGQDRTGLASGLYLLHAKGWGALEEAKGHLRFWPYLHRAKDRQRWLAHFLDFAAQDATGKPIALWARETYEPDKFAAYLRQNGVQGGYTAIQRF
jgi:protein tyrosine/serine phosphatase